jgi:hypothetical protein
MTWSFPLRLPVDGVHVHRIALSHAAPGSAELAQAGAALSPRRVQSIGPITSTPDGL